MLFLGRYAQDPMAVREVLIGQAALLRTIEQGNAPRLQFRTNPICSRRQWSQSMLQFTVPACSGTNHQRTVGHCIRKACELLGNFENPKLLMARAAAPIFSGFRVETRTTTR